MRSPFAVLALLCLFTFSLSAHADPILFTLSNGTFSGDTAGHGAGTITGNVTIDTATGRFVSEDFTVTIGGTQYVFDGPILAANQGPFYSEYYGLLDDAAGDQLLLDLPQTLIGYSGSLVCSTSNLCDVPQAEANGFNGYSGDLVLAHTTDQDFFGSGNLTPTATSVTPEPSSFILLGTGALGLLGAARRRLLRTT